MFLFKIIYNWRTYFVNYKSQTNKKGKKQSTTNFTCPSGYWKPTSFGYSLVCNFRCFKETYSLSCAVRKLRKSREVWVAAIKVFNTTIVTRMIQNDILYCILSIPHNISSMAINKLTKPMKVSMLTKNLINWLGTFKKYVRRGWGGGVLKKRTETNRGSGKVKSICMFARWKKIAWFFKQQIEFFLISYFAVAKSFDILSLIQLFY